MAIKNKTKVTPVLDTSTPQGINPPKLSKTNSSEIDNLIDNIENDPEVKHMDIKLVLQMFKELKAEITSVKKDTDVETVRGVVFEQQQHKDSIKKLQEVVAHYKKKAEIMEGVVIGMSTTIKSMENRIGDLEK